MGKAQDPGPDSGVGNLQDLEVAGDLPMAMTAWPWRRQETGPLPS